MFDVTTLAKFGVIIIFLFTKRAPECVFKSPFLNITLGNQPTIIEKDYVTFLDSTLKGAECSSPLTNFINNYLVYPSNLPYPFVNTYDFTSIILVERNIPIFSRNFM
jgi:hypothetical protein